MLTFTEFVAKRAKWQYDVGADRKLYVVHKPESLVVLDLATGAVVQQVELGAEPCFQRISMASGSVFVTTVQGVLQFGLGSVSLPDPH